MVKNTSGQMASKMPYGMLAVLWMVGWTLRVPILAAPPLATRMADDFQLAEAGVSALTMLPVIAVAFGAIPAAWFITRFGLRTAIIVGLIVMAMASAARGQVPSSTLLFTVSVLMGLGVALFQTALPAATRIWTPTHVAFGSAVYLNGMMLGELSGAGLTLPIVLPLAGGEWRFALVLWTIPILMIAALVALIRLPKEPANTNATPILVRSSLPKWNDMRVWQYGLLLGSSVVAFFVINTYSGILLRERGETQALEAFLFAYNAMPLLASIILLFTPKWIGLRGPIAVSAVVSVIGLAGFIFLTGWASWISAMAIGLASTIELILLVSLPPAIAKGVAVTRLSAGMTLIGFSIAFALPLVGGWLAQGSGWLQLALVPSLVFMVAALAGLGGTARYPNYV